MLSNPRRIAYQGEPGSNSAAACAEMFPTAEAIGYRTFEDALGALTAESVDLAMIPIENSSAGRVADMHHLLPDSGLTIVAEHFLAIHCQLMAVPGATLESIRAVRSHVHALSQCRNLIREMRLATMVADDTAGAAREVAEAGDPTVAALAPRLAAELYGLNILAADVEDEHHNTTRFLVLGAERHDAEPGRPTITTLVYSVRNVPAALYKSLGGFATNGVNMTKLESYQLAGSFSATRFYVDIEGHPADLPVSRALAELAFFCEEVHVLGTYPAHPYRYAL